MPWMASEVFCVEMGLDRGRVREILPYFFESFVGMPVNCILVAVGFLERCITSV